MKPQDELALARGIFFASLLVSFVGYFFFAGKPIKSPNRIVYQATTGKVLFDHQSHWVERRAGISCDKCHHQIQDNGSKSCEGEDCHTKETDVTHGQALHRKCKGCHEENSIGPIDNSGKIACQGCHRR